LNVGRGRTESLCAAHACADRTTTTWTLKPAADGTTVMTITNIFYGLNDANFRKQVREQTPEERRRHFQNLVAGISQNAKAEGGYVTRVETYPATETFTVRAEHFAVPEHGLLYFQLPAGAFSLPGLGADARTLPLYWEQPSRSQLTMQIDLPEGLSAVRIAPPDLKWKAPAGGGAIQFTSHTSHRGRASRLELKANINLEAACIPQADYTELLKINANLEHPERQIVVLSSDRAP